jgi:hypothetical protein
MNSAIVKVLAVVLAWPLVALAIIQAYLWYKEATYVRVFEPLSHERVQHPTYFKFAEDALAAYGKLPKDERQVLKDHLRRVIKPVESWIEHLNSSEGGVICLGESHNDHMRRFMADSIFSNLEIDTLSLETTPEGLNEIRRYMKDDEIYVPLLGADIGQVINAAVSRNPGIRLQAIEETGQQRDDRQRSKSGSREASIFENFKRGYDGHNKSERTVILYGALHCNYNPGALYQHIRRDLQNIADTGFQNTRVQGAHQDGLMETFVYFLDEIGVAPGDFVISNTQDMPIWVRENFVWLWAQTLVHYQSIVVYKP